VLDTAPPGGDAGRVFRARNAGHEGSPDPGRTAGGGASPLDTMRRLTCVIALCASVGLVPARPARGQSATVTVAPVPLAVAGSPVVVSWTVENTGPDANSFGVGAELRVGESVVADLGGQATPVIPAGGTSTGSFTTTLPTWWCGAHVARAAVWTGDPGASTWLDSFDRDFDVESFPLTLAGRVTYHAYSDYLAEPVNEDDGHVFVRSLPAGPVRRLTDGLPVENAVNPFFSPDGARIAFTALPAGVVPPGSPRDYATLGRHLEIFVLDLARATLRRLTDNDVPDEDAKFSPDGETIVFKRDGQVWTMSADGSGALQRTDSAVDKSAPSFSPDGGRIAFSVGDGSQSDIWSMAPGDAPGAPLVAASGIQEYYPLYRDAQTLLFTRWESRSDRHDKLYSLSLASGVSRRLPMNLSGVEDADPFPVDGGLIGFSSTRRGASYDLYLGDPEGGAAYAVGTADDVLQELGGSYSPFDRALALEIASPSAGAAVPGGSRVVVKVRAFADGGAWSEATPQLVLTGPVVAVYDGLRDDGVGGDEVPGDGVYSADVTLPLEPGTYEARAIATFTGNGPAQELRSAGVPLALEPTLAVERIGEERPARDHLGRNYPNPSARVTHVEFALARSGRATLELFDARGVRVRTLVDQALPAGRFHVPWDASRLPSGTYFYRLQAGRTTASRKLVLLR